MTAQPVTPGFAARRPATPPARIAPRRRPPASGPTVASPSPAPTPVPPPAPGPAPTRRGKPFQVATDRLGDPHRIPPKDPKAKNPKTTPPERWDPEGAWRLSDLASACPIEDVDAAHRLDPYWDGLWDQDGAITWHEAQMARTRKDRNLGAIPKGLNMSQAAALERFEAAPNIRERAALLGAVHSWRTLTTDHAAAFVGSKPLRSETNGAVATAWAAGIIDLGRLALSMQTGNVGPAVLRPAKGDVFESLLKDRLTWPEWVAITGGQEWMPPGRGRDRHDLIATELGLRFAEYTEIGTVLGERFSTVDLLAGSGLGRTPIVGDTRAADLTVVREDGLRIAIEITKSVSTHFGHKVERWAQLLAERPLDESGLCVVFLVADPDVRAKVYQAIAAASKEFPGTVRNRVAERMGVATWREWFPAHGLVDPAFMALRVDRPTGRGAGLWEPCDMLDPRPGLLPHGAYGRPFAPRKPEAMTAVLDNAAVLGQTPVWLRARRDPPELWRLLGNGAATRPPVPSPVRPNRSTGHIPGTPRGVAGPVRPLPRLRGLAG